MDKAILVLNAGSSSIKFGIFNSTEGVAALDLVYRGQIKGIGQQARFAIEHMHANGDETLLIDDYVLLLNHEEALQALLEWLRNQASGLDFFAVGHRVVHGGDIFSQAVIIDADVLVKLESLVPLAPLHQPHNLAAIKAFNRIAPHIPQIACFDTAFHRTMPAVAQTFALPRSLTTEGIHPYGFHGLSYEYIASVLPALDKPATYNRAIVAHLGHGASLCAMIDGRSVATTMTFTPLEGLPMATRCGTLDPGVLLYLMTEKGMSVSEVTELLHKRSGLLGISGISGDMRELLAGSDPHAAEAVEYFVYRVAREMGSLAVAAGGIDMLVFTGGIGENSSIIRERVCHQLAWLGANIDSSQNDAGNPRINKKDSPVSIWTIPTNEELIIAQHAHAIALQHVL